MALIPMKRINVLYVTQLKNVTQRISKLKIKRVPLTFNIILGFVGGTDFSAVAVINLHLTDIGTEAL